MRHDFLYCSQDFSSNSSWGPMCDFKIPDVVLFLKIEFGAWKFSPHFTIYSRQSIEDQGTKTVLVSCLRIWCPSHCWRTDFAQAWLFLNQGLTPTCTRRQVTHYCPLVMPVPLLRLELHFPPWGFLAALPLQWGHTNKCRRPSPTQRCDREEPDGYMLSHSLSSDFGRRFIYTAEGSSDQQNFCAL